MEEPVNSFDFKRILLPEEFHWTFLLEVGFRTLVMFILILIILRFSGKRSVKQLSFMELAIVIGLGSAAGDPMFYHDVPLLPVLVVFLVIMLCYRAVTRLTRVSEKAEKIIEGKPAVLIMNDLINIGNLDTDDISYDEFFAFLRLQHIEHIGQVRKAFLETNGEISVFFYPDEEVKPGLPISPEIYSECFENILQDDLHSCTYCAYTGRYQLGDKPVCPNCGNNKWLVAISSTRIT